MRGVFSKNWPTDEGHPVEKCSQSGNHSVLAGGQLCFSFVLFLPERRSGIREKQEFVMTTYTLRMLDVVVFNYFKLPKRKSCFP